MNYATTLTISRMIKQGIHLAVTTKQEVLGHMGGKTSAHKLTLPERETLAKWLIDKLGGTLYVLFDSRGFSYMTPAKDLLAAVEYMKQAEPKKEFVAWTTNSDRRFLDVFKGAVPLRTVEEFTAAYKLACRRYGDDEDELYPAAKAAGANYDIVADPNYIVKVDLDGRVSGFGLVVGETTHTLHDSHLLSSMQYVSGKVDEDTPVWIVKRGQPALPTPAMHPLSQVAPLPNPWGQ